MPALRKRRIDISIIVPVYNLEDFIQPMLDSLRAQDLGKYRAEIIFVDNNCTDNTVGIINGSGLNCTVIQCTEQGCGPARNAGLDIAQGVYVWMLDGDDWLLSDTAVRDVLARAYADNLDILYIPFKSDTYKYQYFSMVPQYLIKREYIEGFRFPSYQPAEDDAFMDRVLHKAGRNRYTYMYLPRIQQPLYYYNFGRPGSNMMRFYAGEKI